MKTIILTLCILSIISLCGCWTTPDPPIPPPEPSEVAYRAFFVGVGDYMFFSSTDLDVPRYNVEKLKKLFNECRFGEDDVQFTIIETLVDHSATKENILNGILSVFAESDNNDVSYFYYMGHGNIKEGIPIITPTDTRFTLETSITVHELEEHLSSIAGTKVVFLETCHAGNFIDKGNNNFNELVIDIFNQQSKDLLNKESYQVLTSCEGEQYTYAHGAWSYFCRALLEGCEELNADTNEDEIVDLTELHKYIREWVWENTDKDQDVQMYPDNSTFSIVEY